MRGKIVVCNLGGEILLVTRVIAFNKQHKLLLLLFFVGLPSVLQNENICDNSVLKKRRHEAWLHVYVS